MEIINDILKLINKGEIRTTRLIYKANLSHQILKDYLKKLVDNNLIIIYQDKKKQIYKLTEKGEHFLIDYRKIKAFIKSYGLS